MQQPQLIARDIYKSFRMGARRIEVLRGISMDIAYNETVFLSGASGAGKTTLLYTLAGLEHPESGTVKFEGRELYSGSSFAEARLRNEKMGFVFQGYFLLHGTDRTRKCSAAGNDRASCNQGRGRGEFGRSWAG